MLYSSFDPHYYYGKSYAGGMPMHTNFIAVEDSMPFSTNQLSFLGPQVS